LGTQSVNGFGRSFIKLLQPEISNIIGKHTMFEDIYVNNEMEVQMLYNHHNTNNRDYFVSKLNPDHVKT
jgi:hypothetical protein